MSSSDASTQGFLPGNARVVMGLGGNGPTEMTVHEIEGAKTQTLDEKTELEFWARVRAKAQAKAREILEQALAEAEAVRAQAREEGFQQGLVEASQACEAQLAAMGGTLAGTMQGIEAERPRLWAVHRQEFAALLKMAVEKVLHTELSERRQEILSNLLDQAIDLMDTRKGFTVLVSPQDEETVAHLLEEARKAHQGMGHWRVKADPALEAGGVRLESDAGIVDNAVDSRFDQISDLLDRVGFDDAQP